MTLWSQQILIGDGDVLTLANSALETTRNCKSLPAVHATSLPLDDAAATVVDLRNLKVSHLLVHNEFTSAELHDNKSAQSVSGSLEVQCGSINARDTVADEYINSSHVLTNDVFRYYQSRGRLPRVLHGIGSWIDVHSDNFSSHPAIMRQDLPLTSAPRFDQRERDIHSFDYMDTLRRGHDQLEMLAQRRTEEFSTKSVNLRTQGAQSESEPSLTTDLSTVETVSAVEVELRGVASLPSIWRQRVPSAPGLPTTLAELSMPAADAQDNEDVDLSLATQDVEISIDAAAERSTDSSTYVQSDTTEEEWLSEYSDDGQIMEQDVPMWCEYGETLVRSLLIAFQGRHKDCDNETVRTGTQNDVDLCNNGQRSGSNLQPFSEKDSQKRNYSKITTSGDHGGAASCLTRSEESLPGTKRRRLFACPFCKKDALRYRDCYSMKLTKVSYVKQHVLRSHSFPIYCSLCMERFETEHARDIHTRTASCQRRPLIEWEGVTESQKQQFKKKPPKNTSEEDQWFIVFKILFPSHDLPSSPFIDGDLSEQLLAFQDFAVSRGPGIVRNVLGPQWLSISESESEQLLERIFSEGLPVVIQDFLMARQLPHGTRPDTSTIDTSGGLGPLPYGNQFPSGSIVVPNEVWSAEAESVPRGSGQAVNEQSATLQPDESDLLFDFSSTGDDNTEPYTNLGISSVEDQEFLDEQLRGTEAGNWFRNEDRGSSL